MKYVILGGTGTLGQAITEEILKNSTYSEIVIFSRDELKQQEIKNKFNNSTRLKFVLGDIKDKNSIKQALFDANTIFHVAALKHIDVLEANPEQSVYTNIIGTINAAESAIECGVPYFVFSSTDKAVDPINTYGMCKGVAEKILYRKNETQLTTRFSVYRWGNVFGSRGSVIPILIKNLKEKKTVYLTDEKMTRFWIQIEDAAKFMLDTYQRAPLLEAMLPPIKSAPLLKIVEAIALELKIKDYKKTINGIRRGEKIHEALRSVHGLSPITSDIADQLELEEIREMVRPFVRSVL